MDFRSILKEEQLKRVKRNPRYSQRAFARDLDLLPSRLSAIIKGRYGLSPDAAIKIADKLNFDERRKHLFFNLVKLEHGRSRKAREEAKLNFMLSSNILPSPSEFALLKTLISACIFHLQVHKVEIPELQSEEVQKVIKKFGIQRKS